MAITIRDVANEAGVSVAAVSKVLHGGSASVRVSEARAVVIREVAQRLQYRPNRIARSLRKSKTDTVGLVFENFGSIGMGPLYYVDLLDGVAEELFRNHYRLTILPEVDGDDVWGTLADGRLDGIIWCKYNRENVTQLAGRSTPIPFVALNAPAPEDVKNVAFVSCDNAGGVRLAIQHLYDLGHRDIAFAMETGELDTPDAIARRAGFLAAMTDLDLDLNEDSIQVWGSKGEGFLEWWSRPGRPTALLAWNDGMANQALIQAQEAGLEIPFDLSVVGFDSTRFCETTTPRLTSVRQPIREMAREAARMVIGMINGEATAMTPITFPCSLDLRESTSVPRRAEFD